MTAAATTPAPGDWTRLLVGAGGSATFDHVLIRYSGGGVYGQSQESIRNDGGALTLHNSTVEYGGGSGIRSYTNGTLDVQDSLIRNNGEHGLFYSASGCGCAHHQGQQLSLQYRLRHLFQPVRRR